MVPFITLLGKGLTQEINGDGRSIWWAPENSNFSWAILICCRIVKRIWSYKNANLRYRNVEHYIEIESEREDNWLFSNSLQPLFQGECTCEVLVMNITSSYSFEIRTINKTKISHLDPLWRRDWEELRNCLFVTLKEIAMLLFVVISGCQRTHSGRIWPPRSPIKVRSLILMDTWHHAWCMRWIKKAKNKTKQTKQNKRVQ